MPVKVQSVITTGSEYCPFFIGYFAGALSALLSLALLLALWWVGR